MLYDIQAAEIATEGLFMNADAGFDSSGFRNTCKENDIIANIDFNKRNSKKSDCYYVFDDLSPSNKSEESLMDSYISMLEGQSVSMLKQSQIFGSRCLFF